MTEEQIKYMVNRFLGWKLPEHFRPDDGIGFAPIGRKGTQFERRREPTGTNLFDADQATAMVRYVIEGIPAPKSRKPMRVIPLMLESTSA